MSWWTIVVLVIGSYGWKSFGALVIARFGTGPGAATEDSLRWFPVMASLIPAALFAALIAVQTLEFEGSVQIDARAAGVAAGVVAVWRKAPFVVVVIVAMAVTAMIRWQTSG